MTANQGAATTKVRLRHAATVFGVGLMLGPPIGALAFSIFRAVATPWGASALESGRLLISVYLAYVFTAVPAAVASAILAWRTWRSGGFGYLAAALTTCLSMLVYVSAAAIVFKRAPVRVVDMEIAVSVVLLAGVASLACTWLLRWAHVIERKHS